MFLLYVLIGFLLITSAFCSENGSNDDSNSDNDSSNESNSSEEQQQCPCVLTYDDADFEELSGFWYIVGISGVNNVRCAHVVRRNNETGILVFTLVIEYFDESKNIIIKGNIYKITEAKYLGISSATASILTLLDADYDRDQGYTLIHECLLRNTTDQSIFLVSRQPEVPDLKKLNKRFKFLSHHSSENSDSADESTNSSNTNDNLDIDLSQYRLLLYHCLSSTT